MLHLTDSAGNKHCRFHFDKMDKFSIKNGKLKKSKSQPLNLSQVTLHMEATKFFENRLLNISYTKNNGWNVKDITDLKSKKKREALKHSEKEKKKLKTEEEILPKDDVTLEVSQKNNWMKIIKRQPTVYLTRLEKVKNETATLENEQQETEIKVKNESSDLPNPEKKIMNDVNKLKGLEQLIFKSKWFEIAPDCFVTIQGGPNTKRVKCKKCNYTCQKPIRMAEHFYVSHDPAKKFDCLYCAEKFASRVALKKHLCCNCKQISEEDQKHFIDYSKKYVQQLQRNIIKKKEQISK